MEIAEIGRADHQLLLLKKGNNDEQIVRKELARVWTRVLSKYLDPNAFIPSVEEVRRELLDVGTEAAVDAVVKAHWFVFPWMIRDDLHKKIDDGLHRFDLGALIEEVRDAQIHPELRGPLLNKVRHHILEKF